MNTVRMILCGNVEDSRMRIQVKKVGVVIVWFCFYRGGKLNKLKKIAR